MDPNPRDLGSLSDSPSQNIFDIGERIKEKIPYRGDVKYVPIRALDPIQELDRLDMFLSDHLSQYILRIQNMITHLGSEAVWKYINILQSIAFPKESISYMMYPR